MDFGQLLAFAAFVVFLVIGYAASLIMRTNRRL
jgi:hypothetical protein